MILLMLAAGLVQFGCGSSEPKTDDDEATDTETVVSGDIDYDVMAKDFCTCMRPMYEFQEKVMQLVAEGKNDEVEALRSEAEKVQSDGEICVAELEAKYGIVEGAEQEEKATKALERACPDIMAMMAEGESLEE